MDVPRTVEDSDTRSPLRRLMTTRGYLVLVISNALGFTGEQMRLAAQSWWILDEGGSNSQVGMAAGLRVIPVVMIGLYAGVMIDRFGGKRVLMVERWILVILALATAFLLLWDGVEVWHIVAISTFAGTALALGAPATNSLVPEIVPTDLRARANVLNNFGFSIARAVGPILASALIAIRNAATAMFGLAILYTASAVVTAKLPPSRPNAIGPGSAIHQIWQGFRYIRNNPVVFWIVFIQAFMILFLSMLFPLVPALAVKVLETSAIQFGWMFASMAIGQAVAAAVLTWRGTPERQIVSLVSAVTIFGGCFMLLGSSTTYWLALVALFGAGMAFPLWAASAMTMLQNFTAAEFRGRVMAVSAIAFQSTSLGWLLGGWLLDTIGVAPTAFVGALGGWVVLLTAIIASKELRSA